jgi:hypothetical protein
MMYLHYGCNLYITLIMAMNTLDNNTDSLRAYLDEEAKQANNLDAPTTCSISCKASTITMRQRIQQ